MTTKNRMIFQQSEEHQQETLRGNHDDIGALDDTIPAADKSEHQQLGNRSTLCMDIVNLKVSRKQTEQEVFF